MMPNNRRLPHRVRSQSPPGWTMVVVEGPDKSGKSTLVYEISLQLGLPIHHAFSGYNRLGDVSSKEIISDLSSWDEKPMGVYEGHPFFHEYIYGPPNRGKISLEFMDPGIRPIINRLRTMALIIYCRPSTEMDEDSSLSRWDLLFRFPLSNFLVMEHDYVDPQSQEKVLRTIERGIELVRQWEES